MNAMRLVVAGFGLSVVLVCATSNVFVGKREEDTVSALSEYLYLIVLEVFHGSFGKELRDVKVVGVVTFENS
jgi:hypothetical protein